MSYISERYPELFGENQNQIHCLILTLIVLITRHYYRQRTYNQQEYNSVVIDVRSSIAYRINHIDGAINMPIEMFEKLIDSNSPFPKERPILLVCRR